MFARVIVAGTFFSVSSLLMVGLLPAAAQAAGYAGWSGYASQVKRPQFRPWRPRSEFRASNHRWRPPARSVPQNTTQRYASANRQAPLLVTESRYSAPVSRAFARPANVGVRFRPNSRGAARGSLPTGDVAQQALPASALHAQFRPKPAERRLTYEEMQAKRRISQPSRVTYPNARYPMATAGSSLIGSFAPSWGTGW